MGVLGAYWYMYSWSTMCILYWIGLLWKGTFELAAVRVIGAYLVLDLANGFIGRSAGAMGGVANFAHVGGAFVGAVLVWALGYKRAIDLNARVLVTNCPEASTPRWQGSQPCSRSSRQAA